MVASTLSGSVPLDLVILFLAGFISSLGIPGGSVWYISSGALANTFTDLLPIIVVGLAAVVLGDFCAYLLARRFSHPLARSLKRFRFFRDNEKRVQQEFVKSEFSLIFFSRFLFTEVCSVVSYASGFAGLKKRQFLIPVIAGETLYAAIYPAIGFFFKETWQDLSLVISDTITVTILIILAFLVLRAYRRRMLSRKSRASGASGTEQRSHHKR